MDDLWISTLAKLMPEILDDVIARIEIGHISYRSKPGKVIQIYWKLKYAGEDEERPWKP